MCVSAAVAVATSVVSFMSAQADYDLRAEQWQQNYVNALASGRDEQNQLQVRMIQEQDANVQRQHLNEIEGAEVKAEAEVSAANAGVSGISLDNILAGINRKVGMKKVADETNHMNTVAQLSHEMEATNTNIQNRINSVQRPTSPNPLGYALQGIGGAMDAYAKAK
ncbi:hypothetical protein F9K91_21125 [Brucella tritici]|uniref:Uncharacterized protein n=1 Tax=Brucella tritici TaxID=94626 RepID=A0A7X6FNM4_9HYPH|nr:hypothetical protein [Brucella tritici]KAB2662740.1 hypothetical protein F9K91_21125 [Brucella tritici]NKW09142.1 hypothetical protein [Brucella tritici]